MRAQFGVGQPVRQQVERFQNRQPRPNQRDELLIENQEFFEIELLAPPQQRNFRREPGHRPPRTDRVNQVAFLSEPVPDFLFARCLRHVLVYLPARVRVF